ncbi:MAG: hypothetical protein AAB254_09715 [candidate division NC10 bacterium]
MPATQAITLHFMWVGPRERAHFREVDTLFTPPPFTFGLRREA